MANLFEPKRSGPRYESNDRFLLKRTSASIILLPEERKDVTASVPDPNLWPNTVSEKTIALTRSPEETGGLVTVSVYRSRAMTLLHAASAGVAALSHAVLPSMSVRPARPRPIW